MASFDDMTSRRTLSRRGFLQGFGVLTAGLALSVACGQQQPAAPAKPAETKPADAKPTDAAKPAAPAATTAPAAQSAPVATTAPAAAAKPTEAAKPAASGDAPKK